MTVMTDKAPVSQRARSLAQLLAITPDDVPGVVDLLRRLQPVLESGPRGTEDSVACFTVLYERIATDVHEQVQDPDRFRDPEFVSRLAVELARRYFAALRTFVTGGRPPRAWAVLFDGRRDAAVGPLEFAVCGVNAHVNLDLAPAVVRTCTVLGRRGLGSTEHHDFQELGAVFTSHLCRLAEHLGARLGREIGGTYLERLLDGAPSLTVVVARDAAWRCAEHLWGLRSRPAEYDRECEAIDWRAAMMGRGVLSIGAL
ncbi:DUF5995 family protein [Pseudonocardia endophytica]|uniref:Uncharacterized protein n=1 Tax=Pseudonocardia endophytica TaxID=401976 RepID=A0A4R1HUM6_PSEEN|nr:DUF5995 family protein [Pseudonocardia endophytica]TCK24665.1 hypothetical protein EV378_0451 [Pseudonocardia endophytica]